MYNPLILNLTELRSLVKHSMGGGGEEAVIKHSNIIYLSERFNVRFIKNGFYRIIG